jgi:hypothetical protein
MGRKERRHRCGSHPDYLLKPDDRCPWCKVKSLEDELEVIRAREEMFKGKDVHLALHSSFDRILEPILRTLGFKGVRGYGDFKNFKEIRIGGLGDHTSHYIVPENTAKAMVEIAEEAEKHLVEAMYYEIQNIRNRVESSIVSDLSDVVNEIVDGDISERSLAATIVKDIFYNDSSKIDYDDQHKLADRAVKVVRGVIEKHMKKGKK